MPTGSRASSGASTSFVGKALTFLLQLPSTACVASTFPQETASGQGCGIRGHSEWAAKPRAGPAPASRYGLRNMSFPALGESESAADVEADVRMLFASSPAWLPFCLVSERKRAHVPPRSLFAGLTPGSSHQLCRHSHGAAGQGSGAVAKQAAGAGLVPSGAGQVTGPTEQNSVLSSLQTFSWFNLQIKTSGEGW